MPVESTSEAPREGRGRIGPRGAVGAAKVARDQERHSLWGREAIQACGDQRRFTITQLNARHGGAAQPADADDGGEMSGRNFTARALDRVAEAFAVGITWIAISWWLRRAERPIRRR